MANERFNHKYRHCLAVNCNLKSDCALHLAYLEAKELNLTDIKTFDNCENTELEYVRVRIEK